MAAATGLQFPIVVYIVVLTHFIDEFGGCGHTQIEFLGQIGNSGAPIIYIMCDDPFFLRVHSCSRFPFLLINSVSYVCIFYVIYSILLIILINTDFIILKYYVFDLLLCKLFCNYALIYINCRLYIN